jgi:hypothetical protein
MHALARRTPAYAMGPHLTRPISQRGTVSPEDHRGTNNYMESGASDRNAISTFSFERREQTMLSPYQHTRRVKTQPRIALNKKRKKRKQEVIKKNKSCPLVPSSVYSRIG